MPLNPLSLDVTYGVAGRAFQATVLGLSSGSTLEVLNDGTPGFSTVNGRVYINRLPGAYPVSTVVLRETKAGETPRESRIDIAVDGIALGAAGLPSALLASGYVTPLAFGAKGDGAADDTAALAAASLAGPVRLPAGYVFRSKSVNINRLIGDGGLIAIDGVTEQVTYVCDGNHSVPMFTGTGIAKPRNNKYSVGWYNATTGDAALAFMNRCMTTSPRKVVVIPQLDPSDPRYKADEYGSPGWKMTNEWLWDDPQNNMRIDWQAPLVADRYGMECLIRVSSVGFKTEDQSSLSLHLDCSDKAMNGIVGHGGARQHFNLKSRITNPVRACVDWRNDLWPCDSIKFDYLSVGRYGTFAVNLEGRGPNGTGINCINTGGDLPYIQDNGARGLYGTVTAVNNGAITGFTIDTGQRLTGFEPGSTYRINGYVKANGSTPSAGFGATATATVGTLTGIIDTSTVNIGAAIAPIVGSGGTGFEVGDKFIMTTAEASYRQRGWHDATIVGRVFHVVGPPLVPPYDSLVQIMATTDGASRKCVIESLDSSVRNRRMLRVGAEAGATVFRHSLTISDIHDEFAPQDTSHRVIDLAYMDDGTVSQLTRQTTSTVTIGVDNNTVANVAFLGIPVERLSNTPAQCTFDGEAVYYITARATDSAGQTPTKPFSGMVSLRRVTLVSNIPNVWGEFLMTDDNTLVTIGKGSLVEPRNNAGLNGTTSTAGNFGISASGGIIYHENRTGAPARYKVIIGR